MGYEKEVLRNVSNKVFRECENNNVGNVCTYLNKQELGFIEEIKEKQYNKSLKKVFDKIKEDVYKRMKSIPETQKTQDIISDSKMQENINSLQLQTKQFLENEKNGIGNEYQVKKK